MAAHIPVKAVAHRLHSAQVLLGEQPLLCADRLRVTGRELLPAFVAWQCSWLLARTRAANDAPARPGRG